MRDDRLDQIAREVVESGASPAAVAAVAGISSAIPKNRYFRAGVGGFSPTGAVETRSIFNLASVTKPFLAVATARAAKAGVLGLSDPLSRWLPELSETPSGSVSLELFLSHRAGLEAHVPLFAPLMERGLFDRAAALVTAANARRAECTGAAPAAGFPPVYSDLGYVLAGEALARALGLPLDDAVERLLLAPLGLEVASARQWLARDPHFATRVLPTESVPSRGGELRGIVHDENAWALAGHGLSGQAGLFGTALGVATFGQALLDALAGRRADFLDRDAMQRLIMARPGGTLRTGFDGKSPGTSAAGTLASDTTFGHLGFTGTSLWCDPAAELVMVLLTNRVCPTRRNQKIREIRPIAHDALVRYSRDMLVFVDQP